MNQESPGGASDGPRHPLDPLIQVMAALRGPGGCPWDLEQDHRSLEPYLIEEAYELIDAIESRDDRKIVEELGDLLLQVVFHTQIASETGRFSIDDIVDAITSKLIRRHPHVFGDEKVRDVGDVLRTWDRLKREERDPEEADDVSLLDGVPAHLPALMYARAIQARAAKGGVEWADVSGALDKVAEESREIAALDAGDRDRLHDEWGDLFFALVNVSRYADIDAEQALRKSIRTFTARFRYIEQEAQRRGLDLDEMSLEDMDALWERAKRREDASA